MSREIISAVYSYAEQRQRPIMLIASKNQVDYEQGYVMTTAKLREYTDALGRQYPKAAVYLCRDHCGPGFNGIDDLKDTWQTIDRDIENGFKLIHVDMCHLKGSYQEKLEQSRQAINHIQLRSLPTLVEIGTDENTGDNFEDMEKIAREMAYFTQFCTPHFFVSQTGSLIKETQQVGSFHDEYISRVKELADRYRLHLKEHNADYLPAEEIRRRQGLIGALNVAPQFGVIQTVFTLHKAYIYGLDAKPFLRAAYNSKKWHKWLANDSPANRQLCAIIAGHYVFNSYAYRKLQEQINRHEELAASLEKEMFKIFDMYLENMAVSEEALTVKAATSARKTYEI